ncbi:S8 family serine peptidase [Haloimpatiens sp. FM7315]|uniref:S8 family serine peptidase n=1 Tax=Haloimpatiens sp. FM7315 TaxID=3298609 RepID=UPI00370A31C7
MFSFKNKLEYNLKMSLEKKEFKNYRVLVHYKNLNSKIEGKIKKYKGIIIRNISLINTYSVLACPYTIERLIEHPEIDYISLDTRAFLCGEISLNKSNALSLKGNLRLTGRGIGIGLIDTGVYPHEDLMKPYKKIIEFKDLIRNYKYPYDDNGHGTFISGILCGSGNSSNGEFKGIAENSHLYSIKAFNKIGRAYISDILFAIQCFIEETDVYNLRLICLPFEIMDNNQFILSLFEKIIDLAIAKGITTIVPAGNNGNDENSIRGIATLKNCITVGGINTCTSSYTSYEYSSVGAYKNIQKPDLVAACVNITSLNSDITYESERNGMKIYPKHLKNKYTNYTGTSAAAAYICGLCALLLENNPQLKFSDLSSLLKVSSNLLNMPKSIQGSGAVNLDKLLP